MNELDRGVIYIIIINSPFFFASSIFDQKYICWEIEIDSNTDRIIFYENFIKYLSDLELFLTDTTIKIDPSKSVIYSSIIIWAWESINLKVIAYHF